MTERRIQIPPRQLRKFSSLSFDLEKILLGSLLGDGCCKINKLYKNARYQERHSTKQEEYFLWKIAQYEPISSETCLWYDKSGSGFSNSVVKMRYCSRALEDLTIISEIVYDKGRKTLTRKWLNSLTPLSLAILWCDDGSLISNTTKGVFCLDSFSFEEQVVFVRYLNKVWGVEGKIHPTNKKFYRTYLNRSNLMKFLRIILPYIPVKSMLCKATLLYKDEELQQRWISEMTELTEFSKKEIELIIESRKEQMKYFRK